MRKLLTAFTLLLVSLGYADAAITVDPPTNGFLIQQGNIFSGTYNHTVGVSSNRVLYVTISGIGQVATSVTYNSTPMTKVADCGGWTCQIWRLTAPPSGTYAVVATFPGLVNSWDVISSNAISFAGVDQTSPENVTAIKPGLNTFESPISLSAVTTVEQAWLMGIVDNHNGEIVASGHTSFFNGGGGATAIAGGYSGPFASGTNTISWTVIGGTGSEGAAMVAINPWSAVVSVPPVISAVSIVANSPLTVKATWTTDKPASSQVLCGAVSGGPYNFASSVIDPNVNNWNVTAHSMPSNPMPNGAYYCIVKSIAADAGLAVSTESLITLPASPSSLPIAMVTPAVRLKGRLGDRWAGVNGAPATGVFSLVDNVYFGWADDGFEYLAGGQMPQSNGLGTVVWDLGKSWATARMTDERHVDWVSLPGSVYPYYLYNSQPDDPTWYWWNTTRIGVNGSIYQWMFKSAVAAVSKSVLLRTDDNYQTSVGAMHNVGPDTSYITNMACNAADGRVTANSKLNLTDQIPYLKLGDKLSVVVKGAVGTNVNGMFADTVVATATTLSWINTGATCAGWSWSASGGTGNGGGTIIPNGELIVGRMRGNPPDGFSMIWIQNDGPGYTHGSKQAGMDAFVYGWITIYSPRFHLGLARIRVEDLPLQDFSKVGYYVGTQNGDDGLYETGWDYTHARLPTEVNPDAFATAYNGKGSWLPQSVYLTDLHRFLVAEQISGITDSSSGGTMIYDGGQYPWSPLTLIGSAQRNVDTYFRMASGPEFPQWIAKSQKFANGVTSISLSHNGGNFGGGDPTNPTENEYDIYTNQGLQFVAKPAGSVSIVPPLLTAGEVGSGMDLAYDFNVPTGSPSMPNAAPSDTIQKWAWKQTDGVNPIWTDNYGSILHSAPARSHAQGYPSIYIQDIVFPTPYTQALTGPLTLLNCFGHYPTTLLSQPAAGAIALQKGTDLKITWTGAKAGAITVDANGAITSISVAAGGSGFTTPPSISIAGYYLASGAVATGVLTNGVLTSITVTNGGLNYRVADTYIVISEPTNNWNVNFLGTSVGNVSIPDNSIGCVVVRRDSANKVSLYTSAGIGKSLPLAASATATVSGPWTTSPLVIGDGAKWGTLDFTLGNSFWGSESLLRVWSRDLADDELISEMAAIRGVLWARGKGSAIP